MKKILYVIFLMLFCIRAFGLENDTTFGGNSAINGIYKPYIMPVIPVILDPNFGSANLKILAYTQDPYGVIAYRAESNNTDLINVDMNGSTLQLHSVKDAKGIATVTVYAADTHLFFANDQNATQNITKIVDNNLTIYFADEPFSLSPNETEWVVSSYNKNISDIFKVALPIDKKFIKKSDNSLNGKRFNMKLAIYSNRKQFIMEIDNFYIKFKDNNILMNLKAGVSAIRLYQSGINTLNNLLSDSVRYKVMVSKDTDFANFSISLDQLKETVDEHYRSKIGLIEDKLNGYFKQNKNYLVYMQLFSDDDLTFYTNLPFLKSGNTLFFAKNIRVVNEQIQNNQTFEPTVAVQSFKVFVGSNSSNESNESNETNFAFPILNDVNMEKNSSATVNLPQELASTKISYSVKSFDTSKVNLSIKGGKLYIKTLPNSEGSVGVCVDMLANGVNKRDYFTVHIGENLPELSSNSPVILPMAPLVLKRGFKRKIVKIYLANSDENETILSAESNDTSLVKADTNGTNLILTSDSNGSGIATINLGASNGSNIGYGKLFVIIKSGNLTTYIHRGWNLLSLPTKGKLDGLDLYNVFGDLNISAIVKYNGGFWSYWDSDNEVKPQYHMPKFATLSSKEGFWIKANSSCEIRYLLDPNNNDPQDILRFQYYKNGWFLIGVNEDMTPSSLASLIYQNSGKNVQLMYVYRNGEWQLFTPDTELNSRIKSNISRIDGNILSEEGIWVLLK